MVSEQDTVELIVTLLESNITDPLNRSKKWIWDDTPRLDLSAYPRIAVTPLNSSYSTLGLGSLTQEEEQIIVVEVYVDKNSKITIDSEEKRAEQIADYLHREIQTIIRANYNYFVTNNICSINPVDFNKSVNGKLVVFRDTFLVRAINS